MKNPSKIVNLSVFTAFLISLLIIWIVWWKSISQWTQWVDYNIISIWSPDNPNQWITIMDRDLWATEAGGQWYTYQWWNNYDAYGNDGEGYEYQWGEDTFIYDWYYYDEDLEEYIYYEGRWDEWAQWPCPSGWHVPTVQELDKLVRYWAAANEVPTTLGYGHWYREPAYAGIPDIWDNNTRSRIEHIDDFKDYFKLSNSIRSSTIDNREWVVYERANALSSINGHDGTYDA